MNLVIVWISFIVFISIFQALNLLDYLLFNISIFCFIYLYNSIKPLRISFKTSVLFCSVPSVIICYITFIYKNFLLITSIK